MKNYLVSFSVILTVFAITINANAQCIDNDNDGAGQFGSNGCVKSVEDCDDSDNTVWSVPGEVTNLIVNQSSPNVLEFSWTAPTDLGGTAPITYDLLRTEDVSDWYFTFTCPLENHNNTSSGPISGDAFNGFYLVRAKNSCGVGTIGYQSNGAKRGSRECR